MKKGLILAVMCVIAAAAAGCAFQAAIPAFLLPIGFGTARTTAPLPAPAEATAAPAATPVPTAVPTAVPAATPAGKEPYEVLARYETTVPEGLAVELAYDKYATPLDYFVAMKGGKVYAKPDTASKKLKSFSFGSRLRLDKLVLGADGKSRWYHVVWSDSKGSHGGYVKESVGKARGFRLGTMLERAIRLREAADNGSTVFITNYKNAKGKPPALSGGAEEDQFGYRRDQSAPAYAEPNSKSGFRYVPDGLLGTRLETANGFTKVFFPTFMEERWVPDKYLSKYEDCIESLRQVVVVDRFHQNSAAFEYTASGWKLISMTYVSTGKPGTYSLKTPLGDFMAQDRYKRFYYYADGTKFIEGFAPWAVRFSGGGYLHGVPRKCDYDEFGNRYNPEPAESIYTLGTTPQSHMCVRNYTSYAKFIYDWFVKGTCAVIVLE